MILVFFYVLWFSLPPLPQASIGERVPAMQRVERQSERGEPMLLSQLTGREGVERTKQRRQQKLFLFIPFTYWARICKPLKEPRNRFPAWRAGTTTLFVVPARQTTEAGEIDSSESVPGLHIHLQIRALYCVLHAFPSFCSKILTVVIHIEFRVAFFWNEIAR